MFVSDDSSDYAIEVKSDLCEENGWKLSFLQLASVMTFHPRSHYLASRRQPSRHQLASLTHSTCPVNVHLSQRLRTASSTLVLHDKHDLLHVPRLQHDCFPLSFTSICFANTATPLDPAPTIQPDLFNHNPLAAHILQLSLQHPLPYVPLRDRQRADFTSYSQYRLSHKLVKFPESPRSATTSHLAFAGGLSIRDRDGENVWSSFLQIV